MIKVKKFTFNPFAENMYLLFDESKEGIIIDPGCYDKDEEKELKEYISEQNIKIKTLVNTHGHIDHVLGNNFVFQQWGVPFVMSKEDLPTYKAVSAYASNYGFENYTEVEPTSFIGEGDRLEFGNNYLDVVFVPGHSVGHIAFISQEQKFVIGGDVLFNGSVGRTDLPGGDMDTLIESIHQKLFVLDDDFVVYCGHGPETTIGKEKVSNPFCRISQD